MIRFWSGCSAQKFDSGGGNKGGDGEGSDPRAFQSDDLPLITVPQGVLGYVGWL